jgi:glycosyltransferase involved in cell wall biosynthesis
VVHGHSAPLLSFAPVLGVPVVHERAEPLNDLYRATGGSNVTFVAISGRQRDLHADVCRARVVHHGLDGSRYPLGAGVGGYAAFLGRFAREKGPAAAIDAARAAGVPLRMGGSPHARDGAYFDAEVRPRLGAGVTCLGDVGHAAKIELLGGAMATLFPIDWEEPFGLVMIESMLCGTPVIAFPRGAAAEVVDDGVTGWLVEDGPEMAWRLRRVATGRDRLDRARVRARAAARFGAARMADDYLRIFEEVAGARAEVAAP